jgi:hypothetical protein
MIKKANLKVRLNTSLRACEPGEQKIIRLADSRDVIGRQLPPEVREVPRVLDFATHALASGDLCLVAQKLLFCNSGLDKDRLPV